MNLEIHSLHDVEKETICFFHEVSRIVLMKKSMKTGKPDTISLEPFKDKHYGKAGTEKRMILEVGYENFKIGALLREGRLIPENLPPMVVRAEKAHTTTGG